MNIKKQIILDDKDYERLVHDANLSNDEIKSKIAPNCMDVYVMVTPFLMGVRNDMENFKLMTVARTMGIEIDENKLHDATYDIELTRDIFYKIINKMDVKL